jgi:hypothetical protein
MGGTVTDRETAESIATEYAEAECVGTIGDVVTVTREDSRWIVELETHTFSDRFCHRIEITAAVGNVVAHDRSVPPT